MGRKLRRRHCRKHLVLLAATLTFLSAVAALSAALLAAIAASWSVLATLRRTPGCAAAATALLAVTI
jgi:hypothetical protein